MRSIIRWPVGMLAVAALLSTVVGCGEDGMTATLPTADDIVLTEIASGLERPVQLVGVPGDTRLFVVQQRGRVRVLAGGQLRPDPYLDISDQISGGNEQGLLGIALHPDFAPTATPTSTTPMSRATRGWSATRRALTGRPWIRPR